MAYTTFTRTKFVALKLDSTTGNNIVPIMVNSSQGISGTVISVNSFVKNLKAFSKITSINASKLPNFKLEDSETDKLYKTLDIEWNSQRKQLDLYASQDDSPWFLVGSISLLNPSGYPYRMYNLLDIYTDNLALELGENGKIGIGVKDVGYGLLQGSDNVTIHGSYTQEIVLDADATPSPLITQSSNLSVDVTNQSTAILPARASRKYVSIFNPSDKIVFLSLGVPATLGKGILLKPNGNYELYIQDINFQGVIHAITASDTVTLTGVEGY